MDAKRQKSICKGYSTVQVDAEKAESAEEYTVQEEGSESEENHKTEEEEEAIGHINHVAIGDLASAINSIPLRMNVSKLILSLENH
mmetsp:Transcript_55499/g.82222  ORF Transcript_55499/g.82222 Transcript_55499/m.82222 type:complete len:86 (-) Transcript_55499:28-285(-)